LQIAFDLLSTYFRHAHASLRRGLQPGLLLARIMECGLKSKPGLKIFPTSLGKTSIILETTREKLWRNLIKYLRIFENAGPDI